MLSYAIQKSDVDLRKTLYSNIVLSGGSTLFKGLMLSVLLFVVEFCCCFFFFFFFMCVCGGGVVVLGGVKYVMEWLSRSKQEDRFSPFTVTFFFKSLYRRQNAAA